MKEKWTDKLKRWGKKALDMVKWLVRFWAEKQAEKEKK